MKVLKVDVEKPDVPPEVLPQNAPYPCLLSAGTHPGCALALSPRSWIVLRDTNPAMNVTAHPTDWHQAGWRYATQRTVITLSNQ